MRDDRRNGRDVLGYVLCLRHVTDVLTLRVYFGPRGSRMTYISELGESFSKLCTTVASFWGLMSLRLSIHVLFTLQAECVGWLHLRIDW